MSLASPEVCTLVAHQAPARELLAAYGLTLVTVADGAPIPGSYWGEPEAGLIRDRIYARGDTPLHSLLHEACHWIVAPPERRAAIDTDASDSIAEENAACYLQVLLAQALPGFGAARCLADMDAWGYSFRLGSARAWFEQDAYDARDWLRAHGLIDGSGLPSGRVRQPGAGSASSSKRDGTFGGPLLRFPGP